MSDLTAAGAADSEQVQLAKGLLSDSETRIIYGQSPGEIAAAQNLLGLTDTEADVTTKLLRGVALWKVGQRSFLVEHRLSPTAHPYGNSYNLDDQHSNENESPLQ